MAKDDYDVIVFKVLTYLYACMKRKIMFEMDTFKATIGLDKIDEGYFADILKMMSEDGLIKSYVYKQAWGGEVIVLSCMEDLKITSTGIRYLEDNSKMKQIKEFFLSHEGFSGFITALIKMI